MSKTRVKITKLSFQQKNPEYVNVFIDDKFDFSVSINLLIKAGLKKGDEVSEIDLRAIKSESKWQKWIEKCLNYISIRPRSKKEIREYIKSKLFKYKRLGILENYSLEELEEGASDEKKSLGVRDSDELSDSIIRYLEERNYLNDVEFACFLIRERTRSSNPRGENYIKSELISKGVDVNEIKIAFATLRELEEFDEGVTLKIAVDKAIARYSRLEKKELKNKAYSYLQRRGFNFSDFKPLVDEKLDTI